jgi:hypothetical protein
VRTVRSAHGQGTRAVARLLAAAALLVAAGCLRDVAVAPPAAPQPGFTHADAPRWRLGDRWVIRWQNPRGSGTTVWTVDREEVVDGVAHYVIASGPWNSFWRKSDLAFHLDKFSGHTVTRYDPPQERYSWPLFPGKTWEQRYRRIDLRRDRTTGITMVCRVDAEETIEVPAGTFPALKITCQNRETEALIHQTWFAPRVKNWVRERGRFVFGNQERELLGFERAIPSGVAGPADPRVPTELFPAAALNAGSASR